MASDEESIYAVFFIGVTDSLGYLFTPAKPSTFVDFLAHFVGAEWQVLYPEHARALYSGQIIELVSPVAINTASVHCLSPATLPERQLEAGDVVPDTIPDWMQGGE